MGVGIQIMNSVIRCIVREAELRFSFQIGHDIVDGVEILGDPVLAVEGAWEVIVGRAAGEKCERCWNYRESVGTISEFPSICDRCGEALAGIPTDELQDS